MSCIVGIIFILKWNKWKQDYPTRLKLWLTKYETLLLFFSLFGGFYATIDALRTKLFYFDFFYFPLKKQEVNQLIYLRFINILILEKLSGDVYSKHMHTCTIYIQTCMY